MQVSDIVAAIQVAISPSILDQKRNDERPDQNHPKDGHDLDPVVAPQLSPPSSLVMRASEVAVNCALKPA
jgi:hypothetical protein